MLDVLFLEEYSHLVDSCMAKGLGSTWHPLAFLHSFLLGGHYRSSRLRQ